MRPLTRPELDAQGCGIPYCGHDHSTLYFHSQCHPKAGLEASYIKATGELVLNCQQCHKFVTRLLIAPGQEAT